MLPPPQDDSDSNSRTDCASPHAQSDRSSEQLSALLYQELRRVAEGYMRGQPPGHTLQPTALVHEAFVRLTEAKSATWTDRGHFLRVAAQAMRWTLIDHARARHSRPAAQGEGSALDRVLVTYEDKVVDLLALNEALNRLEADDADAARLVELRFFAGLSMDEIALTLARPKRSVERDWAAIRARLFEQMS